MNGFFEGIGRGMTAYARRHSRMDQIEKLQAKSDAELAQMGISRDRIVQHVFRDIIFV